MGGLRPEAKLLQSSPYPSPNRAFPGGSLEVQETDH